MRRFAFKSLTDIRNLSCYVAVGVPAIVSGKVGLTDGDLEKAIETANQGPVEHNAVATYRKASAQGLTGSRYEVLSDARAVGRAADGFVVTVVIPLLSEGL